MNTDVFLLPSILCSSFILSVFLNKSLLPHGVTQTYIYDNMHRKSMKNLNCKKFKHQSVTT